MTQLAGDVRYGLRMLLKAKSFSAVVILTLALAIGANSTLFSIVSAVLFRPVPFEDPDSLAFIWSRNPSLNRMRAGTSYPDFEDYRERLASFEDLGAFTRDSFILTGLEEPLRVSGNRVSANFLALMGIEPALGRSFREEDDRPEHERVVMISHGAWQRRFGGAPDILGQSIRIDFEPHRVIGVLPAEMGFGAFRADEVFMPLRLIRDRADRDLRHLRVGGRLKPGVSLEQAEAEVVATAARLAEEHPETNSGWSAYTLSFNQALLGPNVGRIFGLLMMTTSFILLIACGNVANMLMARAARRGPELALRRALGAKPSRLLRQLLTESLILSLLGALLGLAVVRWTMRALILVAGDQIPTLQTIRVDARVLLFALTLALATTLIFGILPAVRLSRPGWSERLKAGGARTGSSGSARRLLVSLEVGMALVLLIVSGLAIQSAQAIRQIDLGFEPSRVLTMRLDLPAPINQDPAPVRSFFLRAEMAVRQVPGVLGVAFASHRPIVGSEPTQTMRLLSETVEPQSDRPLVATVVVTPELFSLLRIPIVSGRGLEDRDSELAAPVALVSRAAAERYWPGRNPLGAQIRLGDTSSEDPWIEIVGVVGDVRNPDADQPPEPHVYLPHTQRPLPQMALLVKTAGEPLAQAETIRKTLAEMDPNQPISDLRTMERIVDDDQASDVAVIGLMSYFSLIALGLAMAGIYGIVSYSVSLRSREIGIRLALGARGSDVGKMILLQNTGTITLGLAIGIGGALALSGGLDAVVYGLSSTDPPTYAAVAALVAAVALAASIGPTWRAARTDPRVTLQQE